MSSTLHEAVERALAAEAIVEAVKGLTFPLRDGSTFAMRDFIAALQSRPDARDAQALSKPCQSGCG